MSRIIYAFILLLVSNLSMIAQLPSGIKYTPKESKTIGIWPYRDFWKVEDYKIYKEEFGITYLLVPAFQSKEPALSLYYKRALEAGYTSEQLLVYIKDTTYKAIVEKLPAAYYYLGEPVEHNCAGELSNPSVGHIYSPEELQAIAQFVSTHRPESKFILDGYKRCSHFLIAGSLAHGVMYSSYVNWNEFPLWNCSVNLGWGDAVEKGWENIFSSSIQSDSWQDMKNIFGDKFRMTWMHGDYDEFDELFTAADELGLETVWFYGGDTMTTAGLANFCETAYNHGWLNKIDSSIIVPPTELRASPAEDGSILLDWKDNSDNESGFTIEKSVESDSAFVVLDSTGVNVANYNDKDIAQATTYYYRIKAFNQIDESEYSNIIFITSGIDSIAKPTDLTLSYEDSTGIILKWFDNSENESGFIIDKMQTTDSIFRTIDTTNADSDSFIDTNVFAGAKYYYRVKGLNEYTQSEFSNIASIRIDFNSLISPGDLSAELSDNGWVILSWHDNSDNETGFIINRKIETVSSFRTIDTIQAEEESYTDSTVIANIVYNYQVYAFNSDTISDLSNSVDILVIITNSGSANISNLTYSLSHNFPNPFNPSTQFLYEIKKTSNLSISIYNTLGEVVLLRSITAINPGRYTFLWQPENLPSGVYFFKLIAESENVKHVTTRKMNYIK